jgi:hypothetical protein
MAAPRRETKAGQNAGEDEKDETQDEASTDESGQ